MVQVGNSCGADASLSTELVRPFNSMPSGTSSKFRAQTHDQDRTSRNHRPQLRVQHWCNSNVETNNKHPENRAPEKVVLRASLVWDTRGGAHGVSLVPRSCRHTLRVICVRMFEQRASKSRARPERTHELYTDGVFALGAGGTPPVVSFFEM